MTFHAVLVAGRARNETARQQAVGEPHKALAGHLRRARPDSGLAVARERPGEEVGGKAGIERRHRGSKRSGVVVREPTLHFAESARQRGEALAVAGEAVPRCDQRRVHRGAARARRVEDVADAFFQGNRDVRLEHLHHVELAAAQRLQVFRHRAGHAAIHEGRIDAAPAQVVLEAHPGRGHFRHRGEPQPRKLRDVERRERGFADQEKRIARDDFAEGDQRRAGILLQGPHHPHRPAPGHVDRAVEDAAHGIAGIGRGHQLDVDALLREKAERAGRIERGIEHRAKIFRELDPH